jgi:predicted acylesterase/phospholipase RssA
MDFLFDEVIKKRKPLDVERVRSSPSRFRISITDASTGASFFVDGQDSRYALLDVLRASATHPLMSERSMRLGDHDCFEGGFANPLPVKDAIDSGCTDLLALLTRPPDYVDPRPGFLLRAVFKWRCARGNAALIAAGENSHVQENRSRDLALNRSMLPPVVNIAAICPRASAKLTRTMKRKERLKAAAADAAHQVLWAFHCDSRDGPGIDTVVRHP